MLHQVQFPDNRSMPDGDYRFCADKACTVGYFSPTTVIPKAQLRAFQAGQTAMLCHCFDISEASYRAALENGEAQAIKDFVVRQTKEHLCACEARNPSGRCCLAGFQQLGKSAATDV